MHISTHPCSMVCTNLICVRGDLDWSGVMHHTPFHLSVSNYVWYRYGATLGKPGRQCDAIPSNTARLMQYIESGYNMLCHFLVIAVIASASMHYVTFLLLFSHNNHCLLGLGPNSARRVGGPVSRGQVRSEH